MIKTVTIDDASMLKFTEKGEKEFGSPPDTLTRYGLVFTMDTAATLMGEINVHSDGAVEGYGPLGLPADNSDCMLCPYTQPIIHMERHVQTIRFLTYSEAVRELELIVEAIESDDPEAPELNPKLTGSTARSKRHRR
jgi:hypothetical protein